jgi:hypothetical protein
MKNIKFNEKLKVPTSKYNGVVRYDGYMHTEKNAVSNFEFKDTLEFQYFSRGRSSVKAHYKGSDGSEYEMFLSVFEDLLRSGKMTKFGDLTGTFFFHKQGQNYGVCMAIDKAL